MSTKTLKCLYVLTEDFVNRIVTKDNPPIMKKGNFQDKTQSLPICCPSSESHFVSSEACRCKSSEGASIPQTWE